MKLRKVFLTILILILLSLSSVLVYYLRPIKYAVKEKDLASRNGYILVEVEKVTAVEWELVGDESGFFNEKLDIERDIRILGNEPLQGYNYDVETGNNVYICYGKYVGEEDFYGN